MILSLTHWLIKKILLLAAEVEWSQQSLEDKSCVLRKAEMEE